MKEIERSYLTEINLGASTPGNGQSINFQDFPILRSDNSKEIWVMGVMAIPSTVLSISPQGSTVVTPLTGIVLTVVDNYQDEKIYQFPCIDLNPENAGGFYRDFKPFKINLTKSYITILDGTSLNANESICFNFLYHRQAIGNAPAKKIIRRR